MTARLLAGGVGLAFLAACTTAPRLPYDNGVGVAEVIRNVRCELATAVAENSIRHPWLRTWAAAVELTLDVTETGGGVASAEIVVPFNVTNTYGLGANAAQESHARNISSVVFATALVALTPKECDRHTAGGNKGPAMLRGSLGLKNWIARASDSIEATGIVEQANGVGYIIEFGLVSAGGLDPNFTIVKIADFQLGGHMGLNAGRADVHTLNIAIVPIRPPRPAPVYVTNLGELKTTTGVPAPKGGGKSSVIVRPAQSGIPEQTQMDLTDIIRSLKQTRTGND